MEIIGIVIVILLAIMLTRNYLAHTRPVSVDDIIGEQKHMWESHENPIDLLNQIALLKEQIRIKDDKIKSLEKKLEKRNERD